MRRLQLPALLAVSLAVAVGVQPASGASNTTPATRAGRALYAIGPNTLKPPECASLTLTSLVTTATGTNAADLQLGTANADSLNGGAGGDASSAAAATTPSTVAAGQHLHRRARHRHLHELRHHISLDDPVAS